jgi:hypothetical protein
MPTINDPDSRTFLMPMTLTKGIRLYVLCLIFAAVYGNLPTNDHAPLIFVQVCAWIAGISATAVFREVLPGYATKRTWPFSAGIPFATGLGTTILGAYHVPYINLLFIGFLMVVFALVFLAEVLDMNDQEHERRMLENDAYYEEMDQESTTTDVDLPIAPAKTNNKPN